MPVYYWYLLDAKIETGKLLAVGSILCRTGLLNLLATTTFASTFALLSPWE